MKTTPIDLGNAVYAILRPVSWTTRTRFFLDAIAGKREAPTVMRRFAIYLGPVLAVLSFGCAEEPDEPNAFQTQTGNTTAGTEDESDSGAPADLPGDGDGDGDGDPTTTGDGDGDPTTTGDGDGDPTTTGDDPTCGDGNIDTGEQCDGGNLGGFSCADLGYSGGTLACDPVTCTFDASGCTNNTDGGGGTTG
jgi:hypothetical protein